jgi:predicted dehydrogenase
MKRLLLFLFVPAFMVFVIACNQSIQQQDRVIKTPVPARPAGQSDVLELKANPIPVVRIAFIGLGMRGPGAVHRMTNIEGVEIVALCDVLEKNVKKVNDGLEAKGRPRAKEFFGDTIVWRKVTALPDVDLVYIATDWLHHVPIAVQAMNDGKHVAIEVPAALNMNDIWALINTSEQTRKHCMQLENCVYDFFELTTLNMVQQGLLGDVIHGEGAYIHGLQPFWDAYWEDWRMDFNSKHRGDVYPTHGLGPVCQAMNIHRGDKLNYLVSIDTKAIGNPAFIKEKRGVDVKNFRNGDHTTTLIRTEKEKTIMIQHDVTSPRPYNRLYQLTGTKGFANKYPTEGYALSLEAIGEEEFAKDHEKLSAHSFVPADVREALMQKYKHPIAKDIEEKAKQVGGHGGMDFIMDYRLIYCLQKGLPLDMDVYDLAEWCCLIPLTEISLDNNSAPVEIPDFTRGGWNKINGLKFAQ